LQLASLFNPKAKLFVKGRQRIFQRIATQLANDAKPKIWVHCASLGEFEQGRPIIESLKANFPHYSIVLTFFSPSGFEVKKDYDGADHIFYLPIDSRQNAKRFIELINPVVAIFVKYEFWYHYLNALHNKRIPTMLCSAIFQPRHPFFKWYGGLYRKMLTWYDQLFVQDAASEKLLQQINITNVQIVGDTRFDRAAKVLELNKSFENIALFKSNHKLIVAGSTWIDDEILLQKTLESLPETYKLLLAPHEIGVANIERIQALFPNINCLWNATEDAFKESRVCIVNTMGQLSYLYKYADIVWMGGGFTKSGIHNIIEPAVFGVPIFFGPNYKRYREATDMIAAHAAISLSSANEFTHTLLQNENALLQQGNNAKKYVLEQLGATQKIVDYLAVKCLSTKA
jgi:3-deoxy-D-manno-octulosonic-acid transferase